MRRELTAVVLVCALAVCSIGAAESAAQSRCDAGITKAAGKKLLCKSKVHARAQRAGTEPDAGKLAQCEEKFAAACAKAQAAGDCAQQIVDCSRFETELDTCVGDLVSHPTPMCPTTGGDPTVCQEANLACVACCMNHNPMCSSACGNASLSGCLDDAKNDA
jgi:hypothetical protein